jgi:hypothetical protein
LGERILIKEIKENIQLFFIVWAVILVLNQIFIFGACFAPYCILAALPHTGIISFFLTIYLVKNMMIIGRANFD